MTDRIAQVRGILRLELRKTLIGRRAIPIVGLAMLPVGFVLLFMLVTMLAGVPDELRGHAGAAIFYVGLYQFLSRFILYFGCAWLFMNLFRGEVLDRSLHYYFLSPIRREVLVAGKYVAALASSLILFGGATLATFALTHAYLDDSGGPIAAILGGPSLGELLNYLGVTLLACVGYGAVFLLVGLFFRNPIVPALLIFIWEGFNPFLPAVLKKISVIFYVQSLLPIPPEQSSIAVIADPVPIWLAIPGLIIFTAITLVLAGWRVRHMEISYAGD